LKRRELAVWAREEFACDGVFRSLGDSHNIL
jgi:hypothetical protein